MPLHDWTDHSGWDGVHLLWIAELVRWIKPRLPADYRVYAGSAPLVAVGAPPERSDVRVRRWTAEDGAEQTAALPPAASTASDQPDEEIAVATLDPAKAVYVERHGRLVAAIELVSPHNKDRPIARDTYLARYLGYLMEGVHLLLVDVHRRPLHFSFADRIAQELQIAQPPCPPPLAVGYRVGEPAATGGRILGIWRRPLAVGAALPSMTLPLTVEVTVPLDLEQTYSGAAADAYL
jgi:hypothetical protein